MGYAKYVGMAGLLTAAGLGAYAAVATLSRQIPGASNAYNMVADLHPVSKALLDASLGMTVVGTLMYQAKKMKWIKPATMNLGMAAFAGAFGMSILTRPGLPGSGLVSNLASGNAMSAVSRLNPFNGSRSLGMSNSNMLQQQVQQIQQNSLNQAAPNMGSNLFGTRRAMRSSVNLF